MTETLKICTFNVNGLGDRVKRKAIFQSIRDKKVDLCLMQETHSTHQTHLLWKNKWGGDIHFSHGTSCGVAILIRRGLNTQIMDKIIDPSGRYMIMKMNIEGSELILGNLYAPTQDKENDQLIVLNQLKEQLMPFSDEPILLGGDFNIALDPEKDRRGTNSQKHSTRYRQALKGTIEMLALTDYWKEINPDSRRYTFHRKNQGSRLDYWFISNFYKNKVKKCTIDIGTHSDHSPVTLSILTEKPKRGPGMWKINNILLQDQEYVQRIKDLFCTIRHIHNKNMGGGVSPGDRAR